LVLTDLDEILIWQWATWKLRELAADLIDERATSTFAALSFPE